MKMAAGEAEAASALGALASPCNYLQLTASHRFADGGVAFVGAIPPAHCALGGDGAEQRRDSLHAFTKPDVKVPLIANRERLYPGRDRVLLQFFELRIPGGVDRPIDLEGAADPIEKLLLAFFDGRFGRVMDAGQADPFLHEHAQL